MMQGNWKLNTALAASLATILLAAPNAIAQTKEKPPISVRPLEEQPSDRVDRLEETARDMIDAKLKETPPTMENIKDMPGLRRIIEHNARENALAAALDRKGVEDQLRKAGVDYDAIREFAEFLKNGPFAIERVEFIPGWDVTNIAAGIVMDVGDVGKYEGGDFGAIIPSLGSFVGHNTRDTIIPFGPSGRDGHSRQRTFSDGSTWSLIEITAGARGHTHVTVVITDENGDLEFSLDYTIDKNGRMVGPAERRSPGDPSEPSEARDDWKHFDDGNGSEDDSQTNDTGQGDGDSGDGDSGTDGDDGSDTGGDDDEQTGGDDIDGYQPADGNEGSFCPSSVEYCRRGREDAEVSNRTILTGLVLVNPGDPVEPMNAPRLIYDPEDFVINPDPNVAESNKARPAPVFQMFIPVHVNPPGPNDLNDLRDALGIDK